MNRYLNKHKTSENFLASEHQCQGERYGTCKCEGAMKLDSRLSEIEQRIRDRVGRLIKLSGYRCPEHNRSLPNSSPTSQHMHGTAGDYSIEGTGLTVDQLAEIAIECGAVRVGKYYASKFIHVSCEDVYKPNGEVGQRSWIGD